MKHWLVAIFRGLEDWLDPQRRNQLAERKELYRRNTELQVFVEQLRENGRELCEQLEKQIKEASPVAVPSSAPEWTVEFQVALRMFLGSPAGVAFKGRARAIQFHNNTEACKDAFHTSHSAGAAKGFGECLDWLESLSRVSARPTDNSEPGEPTANDATLNGESALREQMSP